MKKLLALTLCLLMIAVQAACGQSNQTAQSTDESGYNNLSLKINVATGETGIDFLTAQKFADLISERSGGVVSATVYSNAQLTGGDMSKSIDLLLAGGSFEMAVVSGAVLSNLDSVFTTHMLPFIFSGYPDANSYLDGTGGTFYTELGASKGLTMLGYFHNGMKQWTHKSHPLTSVDDFKNMKIRIPSGEVLNATFNTMGADPISMNWGEVYTALQQGTIDGHENSYMTINSASIQEVNPFITESNYCYEVYTLTANSKDFNQWNEKTQTLIRECAQEASLWGRQYQEDTESEIKANWIANGITVTVLTEEQKKTFFDATASVRSTYLEKFGKDACAAWGITD